MADNLEQSETAKAWAEIVIKIWEDKLTKLKVNTSYSLINSLTCHVSAAANGNIDMIQFFFNYYGKFVDMGVGKGVTLKNMTTVEFTRKAKPWYTKTFYSQLKRLSQILAEKYGQRGAITIVENVDDNALKWEKQWKKI